MTPGKASLPQPTSSWPFLQLQVYLCLSQQDAFWGLGITAPPGLIQEPIHHHRLQQS